LKIRWRPVEPTPHPAFGDPLGNANAFPSVPQEEKGSMREAEISN
jgi:hypothetical protein